MNFNVIIKIAIIIFVSLLLIGILGIIDAKIDERHQYQTTAKQAIAKGWSGEQSFAGPLIYLRFEKEVPHKYFDENLKKYVQTTKNVFWNEIIVPDELDIQSKVTTQTRQKGIFKIPVYETELSLNGKFLITKEFQFKPISAKLMVAMNDRRGLGGKQTIRWNGNDIPFQPGIDNKLLGGHLEIDLVNFKTNSTFAFQMDTRLRGLDTLNFVPTAKQYSLTMNSNWPHPYFVGEYLPNSREISDQGFSASWDLTNFSTSIESTMNACAKAPQNCSPYGLNNSLGIGFFSPIDVYQKTDRALKYGFLFIFLTFIVFFLFECIKDVAIHSVQYTLVGFALALFYLVLISLSEHIGFDKAYIAASIACVSLIAAYLSVVFKNFRHASLTSSGLALLYAMLFFILKSEDYALLMGTSLIFTVLAIIMYTTRDIDWYGLIKVKQEKTPVEE